MSAPTQSYFMSATTCWCFLLGPCRAWDFFPTTATTTLIIIIIRFSFCNCLIAHSASTVKLGSHLPGLMSVDFMPPGGAERFSSAETLVLRTLAGITRALLYRETTGATDHYIL